MSYYAPELSAVRSFDSARTGREFQGLEVDGKLGNVSKTILSGR